MEYKEEDYILLSGLQHFEFCQRQWALIHIEQQWNENLFTVQGNIFHEKAHDKDFTETRGNVIISRAMPVFSATLGVSGECDVVEFHKNKNGVELFDREGKYIPVPIEYKKGKPKENEEDIVQLVGQAMCLEEMLCCDIKTGYLYYGETRKRVKVDISDELKERVKRDLELMHTYMNRNYTPNVKRSKKCNSCSLKEVCVTKRNKFKSVADYMEKFIKGDDL